MRPECRIFEQQLLSVIGHRDFLQQVAIRLLPAFDVRFGQAIEQDRSMEDAVSVTRKVVAVVVRDVGHRTQGEVFGHRLVESELDVVHWASLRSEFSEQPMSK